MKYRKQIIKIYYLYTIVNCKNIHIFYTNLIIIKRRLFEHRLFED